MSRYFTFEAWTAFSKLRGERPKRIGGRIAVLSAIAALMVMGSAGAALQALPAGEQVNNDQAAGIDKTLDVSGEAPSNSDVVGGALTAGKPAVPWAIFRQQENNGAPPPRDQIFARSFAGGHWTTRGAGTVGGVSSAAPQFSGSLNFNQEQDGEAPSIDFAGSGRTVPWATWYEDTFGAGFEANNIFASRFDNTGDANQGKWIFGGQARGTGEGTVQVPSLNIHTDQSAENPSLTGGSAVDPTKPGPWVAWQETTAQPVAGRYQIFVSRPIGPGAANCDGVKPRGVEVNEHVPAIGGFCFQQTGIPRVGPEAADPSISVNPARDAIEPDITFTGTQDGVPWVVWYETGKDGLELDEHDLVFAAKGVKDETAEGGFHWVAVGSQLSGTLDASGKQGFGACTESVANEEHCSLNKDAGQDAEHPRIAGGTMNAANPTVPWVTWDEEVNGVKQVFVSRLAGSGAAAHFEVLNGGAPVSTGTTDASRPDITFSGNTPYVSWRKDVGGGITKAVTGHFVNPANPTFVVDQNQLALTPSEQANVREPISSSCIATPFNVDGAACQGAAIGTPFFLSTSGVSPRGLFANAYQPLEPETGAAANVGVSSATVAGTVNPQGAAVHVSFQFGTTTAYGQTTAPQSIGVGNAAVPFNGSLVGLPAAATVHYRAVAVSDFGTFVGADQTLTTAAAPPTAPSAAPPTVPPIVNGVARAFRAKVTGSTARVPVSCTGPTGATCRVSVRLSVAETFRGHHLVTVTAGLSARKARHVVIGSKNVTLAAGQTEIVRISLNRTGLRLLARRHALRATLRVTQTMTRNAAISEQIVKFNARRVRSHHGTR